MSDVQGKPKPEPAPKPEPKPTPDDANPGGQPGGGDRQFNGRMIEQLCELGSRMVDIAIADIRGDRDRVCHDPFCRWYSATMPHYIGDHAQMDEIFREEQRHLGR